MGGKTLTEQRSWVLKAVVTSPVSARSSYGTKGKCKHRADFSWIGSRNFSGPFLRGYLGPAEPNPV